MHCLCVCSRCSAYKNAYKDSNMTRGECYAFSVCSAYSFYSQAYDQQTHMICMRRLSKRKSRQKTMSIHIIFKESITPKRFTENSNFLNNVLSFSWTWNESKTNNVFVLGCQRKVYIPLFAQKLGEWRGQLIFFYK